MKKKLFCVTCLLLLQTAFFAAPVYQPVQAAKGGILYKFLQSLARFYYA